MKTKHERDEARAVVCDIVARHKHRASVLHEKEAKYGHERGHLLSKIDGEIEVLLDAYEELDGELSVRERAAMDRAVNIATGCHDYGGGHSGAAYAAFQHGISTVVNVLTAALDRDPNDTQLNAVEAIGAAARAEMEAEQNKGGGDE